MQTQVCCICHNETLNNRFSCIRCKEGTICEECWDNESMDTSKCPVCRFSTRDEIWFNMEERVITDEENQTEITLRRRKQERIKTQSRIWMGVIFLLICLLCSIIGTFVRAFIIDHDYYTCYFNCKDEDGKNVNNAITIGESFVIGLVVVMGLVSFILVSMLLCTFCNCIINMGKDFLVKIKKELDNRFDFTKKVKKITWYSLLLSSLLFVSLIAGFLFKHSNNFCNWDCLNISNVWSVTTTILIGGFISLIVGLFIIIIISCISGCLIGFLEIGTINDSN